MSVCSAQTRRAVYNAEEAAFSAEDIRGGVKQAYQIQRICCGDCVPHYTTPCSAARCRNSTNTNSLAYILTFTGISESMTTINIERKTKISSVRRIFNPREVQHPFPHITHWPRTTAIVLNDLQLEANLFSIPDSALYCMYVHASPYPNVVLITVSVGTQSTTENRHHPQH